MEDLLLWRWSSTVQLISAMVLAIFFTALGRSVAGADTRWWMHAFQANLLAIVVTALNAYGLFDTSLDATMRAIYVGGKTLFVLCLVSGLLVFRRSSADLPWTARHVLLISFGAALVTWLFASDNGDVRGWHGVFVALTTGWAAFYCFRHSGSDLLWLGVGLAVRAGLGAFQVLTHVMSTLDLDVGGEFFVLRAQVVRSAFDSGAEWLILLGCVVALARRSERRLEHSHAELQRVNAALVDAVQRDPLTGLSNRRALAPLLEVAGQGGATLLFFDLDDFKAVNDRYGHDVGDACLRRFSAALRERFADADGVIRYAGDEFVVVDARNSPEILAMRLDGLRAELQQSHAGAPAVEFSVGLHRFPAGVLDLGLALREADQAMYRDKADRRAVRRDADA